MVKSRGRRPLVVVVVEKRAVLSNARQNPQGMCSVTLSGEVSSVIAASRCLGTSAGLCWASDRGSSLMRDKLLVATT